MKILGFGWLYLFINFPLPVFCKIGITAKTVQKRAKQVDKAMPGIPIPVFAVYTPFARSIEQAIHWLCWPLSCKWFYRGDGHTEVFLIPAALLAFAVQAGIWSGYIWLGIWAIIGKDEATYGIIQAWKTIFSFIL